MELMSSIDEKRKQLTIEIPNSNRDFNELTSSPKALDEINQDKFVNSNSLE